MAKNYNTAFQQPLDPLRNSAMLMSAPPSALLTRTRPSGVLRPNVISVGEPIYRGRRVVPAERGPITPEEQNQYIHEAAAAPPDIIDAEINERPAPEPLDNINEVPANELFAEEQPIRHEVPQENYAELDPALMGGNRPGGDISDLDGLNDLAAMNDQPPAAERPGLLHRIFHRDRGGAADTIRVAGNGRWRQILNIAGRIARYIVPMLLLGLIVAFVIANWAAIKSMLLVFATFWILAFGALILISRNRLNHQAVLVLSTITGIIAVLIANSCVLRQSILSTLYAILMPIFIIWLILTVVRGLFPSSRR